ncbi:ISAs1 family transposase, partial [Candidatus Entotheonella serta]
MTIDAMGCQKEIAQVITEQGADYVVALKTNHSTLYDDVKLFLDDAQASGFAALDYAYHETVDGEHGRIETRRYWTTSEIDWLGAKMSW